MLLKLLYYFWKKWSKLREKIEEISEKIWENNINEILDKFWIKFLWSRFVEHLKKVVKTLDYFLIKFELISSIEV